METITPKDSKKSSVAKLRHQFEYSAFIQWVATPKALRSPKTQQELSKKFGVGADTLSEWKQQRGFWNEVAKKHKEWGRERTPDVISALYDRIMKTGGAAEVKLWMQVIEAWQEEEKPEEGGVWIPPEIANMTDQELDEAIARGKAFFKKQKYIPPSQE